MTTPKRCNNCRDGDWVVKDPKCNECNGWSKWRPRLEKKEPPKPTYIGHRKDGSYK